MIQLKEVSKILKSKVVLEDISYEFVEGKIYGLYGKNGCGKTMLLRMISGLIIPSSGTVSINNQILHEDISFPPNIGVIIENMELLPQLTGVQNLEVLAKINKKASIDDIQESLKRVGLTTTYLPVKKYSLGMKQRLNIAQAIFEKPSIILLDEPTNAIDEEGVKMIHQILKEEASRGAIIILSSHNKEDIYHLCDEVIYMNEGKINE